MSLPLLIQFLLCPVVLVTLLFIAAPYGRHYRAGWGPAMANRPAWVLMELPALLVIGLLVLTSPSADQPGAYVPLLFWVFHYGYRTLVFPLLMHTSAKTFPVTVVLSAIGFNTLNGYNNAQALIAAGHAQEPLLSAHLVVGALIFLTGFTIHVRADRTIRRLRAPGTQGYGIPTGGLFRWVSNPHYLGEIIQWSGWAVMTWSLAGLAFALFTFCNLAPRALANHRWYISQFSNYPRRWILIPGLF